MKSETRGGFIISLLTIFKVFISLTSVYGNNFVLDKEPLIENSNNQSTSAPNIPPLSSSPSSSTSLLTEKITNEKSFKPLNPNFSPSITHNKKLKTIPSSFNQNLTTINDSNICQPRILTPALWNQLNLTDYLLNYPGGHDISLEQLAIDSKLLNFDCGISKMCYAGQLCSPVFGKNWYILVAAQEWNSYLNIIYESIGFAMTMMQVHPTEGHASITKWWMQLVQGEIGLGAGEANIMDYAVIPDPVNQHDKWTYFIYQLSKDQDRIQSELTKSSEEIISSGISTESGIYGALKGGEFLVDHVHTSRFINFAAKEQSEMKLSIELHLLAAIWIKQKYFIVRGSDPCEYSGPNGAFGDRNELSYCGPDNIMMTIVKKTKKSNKNHQLTRKVYNGDKVFEKYNFSTKFLIERAWNCQKNLNKIGFDVWNSSSSIGVISKCSFNLPVCDLTNTDLVKRRKKSKSKMILELCKNYTSISND